MNVCKRFGCLALGLLLAGCSEKIDFVDHEELEDYHETVVVDLPVTDQLAVLAPGTLFLYQDQAFDLDASVSVHDNLVARFASVAMFSETTAGMKAGDCVLLETHDFEAIGADAPLKAKLAEAYHSGGVSLFLIHPTLAEAAAFCRQIGLSCPLAVTAGNGTEHLACFGVAASKLSGRDMVFTVEDMDEEDDDAGSEYDQGHLADQIVRDVNEAATKGPVSALRTMTRGGGADLTALAKGQYFNCQGLHSRAASDYYDGKGGGTNRYQMRLDVWSCHSLTDNSDYYYVEQSVTCSFANTARGSYHKSVGGALSKIQEWYGSKISAGCAAAGSLDPNSGVTIVDHAPTTTTGSTTYSSGLTWSLTGNASYNKVQGPGAGVSGGLSVSTSRSREIKDVNIYDQTLKQDYSSVYWDYELKKTGCHYAWGNYGLVSLEDCSDAGRNSFTVRNSWIYQLPRANTPSFQATASVELTSSRARYTSPYKTGVTSKSDTKTFSVNMNFNRPPLP